MSTKTRPELSLHNPYWIDRHRYYELKHFCLQYPLWKKSRSAVDGTKKAVITSILNSKTNVINSPTERCAEERVFYSNRIDMVEKAAKETDSILYRYILRAVTEGMSYDYLRTSLNIPCSKDTYYNLYRRFFWLLSKERQ